jgi:hypothetical protein
MSEPYSASRGGFERVEPLGEGFIRGPARLLIAPFSYKFPTEINSIINLEKEANYKTEKQKISKLAEPTVGSFYLGFGGYATPKLEYTVKISEIVEALEGLPSIGTGNIKTNSTATKKLSEEEAKLEFIGELKNHGQPLIEVLHNSVKKTAEEVAISVTREQSGAGEYDPQGEWSDLGATKGGIKIMRNNTESLQDIDQIQAAVAALPDEWEMSIETALAETSEERLEVAWEGLKQATQKPGVETIENTPEEKVLGMGNPLEYTERRLAVIYKGTMGSNKGKLKAFCFRKTTRSATSSTLDFNKTGNMSTVNTTFRCFAEPAIANPKLSMGLIFSQKYA